MRARTILGVLGLILAVAVLVEIVLISRQVLIWIVIAIFFALALNPAVDWFMRRGIKRRGYSVGIVYVLVFAAVALIGYVFIPPLVDQVNNLVDRIPGYIDDLTKGKGRLGFLETKYHIVERVRDALKDGGAEKLFGVSGTVLSITKSVITIVVAAVTITFMTFFMLLEGPFWVERFYTTLPARSQSRWRTVGRDIYRTVGGYVLGNLVISIIAGGSAAIVLYILGVPLPFALGLLVGLFDLIPLAGATIALLIVGTISFLSLDHRRNRGRRVLPHLPAAREPRPPAGDLREDGQALAAHRAARGADRRRPRRHHRRARGDPHRRRYPRDHPRSEPGSNGTQAR